MEAGLGFNFCNMGPADHNHDALLEVQGRSTYPFANPVSREELQLGSDYFRVCEKGGHADRNKPC